MPIDPSIAMSYRGITPPDPLSQYAKIAELQSAQQGAQINQLRMAQMQQEIADANALRKSAQGLDLSTPEGLKQYSQNLLGAGNVKAYQEFMTAQRAQEKADSEARAALLNTAANKSKMYTEQLSGITSPEQLATWYLGQAQDPDMRGSPVHGMPQEAILGEIVQNTMSKQPDGSFAVDPEKFDDYKKRLGLGIKGYYEEQSKAATAAEQARHNRETEAIAKARFDAEREKGNFSPETIDYLAEIFKQTGTLPPLGLGASETRMKIFERARQTGTALGAGGVEGVAPTAAEAAGSVAAAKQTKAAEQAAVKAFSSGLEARRVTANNTAINHLETMDKLSDALANTSDVRAFNAAANLFSKETGATAPTNFNAAKQIVAAEVIKAVVQNGGGVTERQEAAKAFSTANTPEQLKGVINTYRDLLGGQLQSLKQQYESGTNRTDFDKKLSPNTRKLLTPSAAAPAAGTAPNIQSLLDKYK